MPASAEHDRLRVVLVSTRNPLNIGAAARALSNFGFHHLRVVNPYQAAFREARSAVGASELLVNAEEYSSVAEAVADCSLVVATTAARDRELQHPLRRLEEGARLIRKRLASGRVALLFGSEKRGLSNHDLSHCHWLLRVPTGAEHLSMNLGQAVAVCLYELARGYEDPISAKEARSKKVSTKKAAPTKMRSEKSPPETLLQKMKSAAQSRKAKAVQPSEGSVPATAGQLERITEVLLDALRMSGYLHTNPATSVPPSVEEKLRRQVRRLHLSAGDAKVWLGMLRQIVWKMHSQ